MPEEPKGLFSTIDGANAARWAWILLGIGEEDEVMAYVDWFVARARDKSNHVPALQAYWQRTSWNLAMALRNNKSFGAAAKEIMDNVALWQEVLLSTPAPTKRTEKEILRPHGTHDDIEEAQTGQGGGFGSWGRKRRRGGRGRGRGRGGKEQDHDAEKKTEHQAPAAVVVRWGRPRRHSRREETARGSVVGPR